MMIKNGNKIFQKLEVLKMNKIKHLIQNNINKLKMKKWNRILTKSLKNICLIL